MAQESDLPAFVREHLRSVWALELLMLLRADPERRWASQDLVTELRASKRLVSDNLARFERAGLAMCDDDGCWSYHPANKVQDELADLIEAAYRERPVWVISLIAAPVDPLQSLADAFVFKGDGK